MEDAAIHELDHPSLKGNYLFGVFDGHGGTFIFEVGFEVSKYVEKIFIKILTDLEEYKKGDYKKALELTFQKVDEAIDSPQGAKELMAIRGNKQAPE